jgi:hypothetical protein
MADKIRLGLIKPEYIQAAQDLAKAKSINEQHGRAIFNKAVTEQPESDRQKAFFKSAKQHLGRAWDYGKQIKAMDIVQAETLPGNARKNRNPSQN